ncbi:hypothetical protein [Spirosoma pollinicola]|uniref:Uncharacterized protein n=1 Tax=Spirosoma pollinicola TaxID=2057025 RepID=A0A2K8YTP6_9BACT|nr:hypothetical protein [Spirosoma pollinicola]AUD00944.1 hypothetical protein CWM47_03400 [Spirosoma pollinicola]
MELPNRSKFIPFSLTIVDVVEMINAATLVITGYNIGNSAGWFAISTGAIYAIGKKFVELAKAKTPFEQSTPILPTRIETDPATFELAKP